MVPEDVWHSRFCWIQSLSRNGGDHHSGRRFVPFDPAGPVPYGVNPAIVYRFRQTPDEAAMNRLLEEAEPHAQTFRSSELVLVWLLRCPPDLEVVAMLLSSLEPETWPVRRMRLPVPYQIWQDVGAACRPRGCSGRWKRRAEPIRLAWMAGTRPDFASRSSEPQ